MEKNRPTISKLTELNPAEIKELIGIIDYKIYEHSRDAREMKKELDSLKKDKNLTAEEKKQRRKSLKLELELYSEILSKYSLMQKRILELCLVIDLKQFAEYYEVKSKELRYPDIYYISSYGVLLLFITATILFSLCGYLI